MINLIKRLFSKKTKSTSWKQELDNWCSDRNFDLGIKKITCFEGLCTAFYKSEYGRHRTIFEVHVIKDPWEDYKKVTRSYLEKAFYDKYVKHSARR